MTPLQATEQVYETVRQNWTATTHYELEGERPQTTRPDDAAWVRVVVRQLRVLSSTHGPAGSRQKRIQAQVIAQVFAPNFPDDGVGQADLLAQTFAAMFDGKDIPPTPGAECLNFEPALPVRHIGADGNWFQTNAEMPFTYDQTF